MAQEIEHQGLRPADGSGSGGGGVPAAAPQVTVPARAEAAPPRPGASPPPASDAAGLLRSVRRPMAIGFALIAVFLVGFVGWGSVAPLAGGAMAPGVISPDGSRRTVQHLEGGIIGDLLVKEHDTVEAGAPLLVLEETQARANYDMLRGQYRTLLATHARLSAEQLLHDTVQIPEALAGNEPDPEIAGIVRGQRHLFETRKVSHDARKRILLQRIEQLHEQIKGQEAQVQAASQQLAIIADELVGKEQLYKKELLPKPELLALKRRQAEILGDRGEYEAGIARARQQIGETEIQHLAVDAERADEVALELDKTRAQLAEVHEKLLASADVLKRTVIAAPVSGRVVNLRYKTKGGVVRAGEPILDLVPLGDELLIDARLSPTDIDVVHPGLRAQVNLSAFASRIMPRVDGTVRSVSGDRLVDEQTGQPYYLARVEVDRERLKREVGPEIELVSGMPAEVLIVTGERTMMGYLLQPFRDVFRRGLRES